MALYTQETWGEREGYEDTQQRSTAGNEPCTVCVLTIRPYCSCLVLILTIIVKDIFAAQLHMIPQEKNVHLKQMSACGLFSL